MDLEAQTLSELSSFYALSIYMGFGSRFYLNYGCLAEEGSNFDDFFQKILDFSESYMGLGG